MSKTFWAVIAIIIAVIGGILLFNGDEANAPGGGDAKPTSHIKGEGTTGLTLLEYGDYQCPACYRYEPVVQQVYEKYKDQLYFQFRHLPLLQIHQNAFAAARAAEAAEKQGKFWEMHGMLYQNQPTWQGVSNPSTYFEQYAAQLGMDVEKYKTDAASSAVNDIINADISAFSDTGESKSTPTFFLDGKKITVEDSVESFSAVIDEAIENKSKETPADL